MEQLNNFFINIKNNKYAIPFSAINHNEKNEIAYILISGLNGTRNTIAFFNGEIFKDCTLISFDARAQGENKNKSSRFYKKYIEDIRNIILELKNTDKFKNIKKWNIIGESWGGALSILYMDKYGKKDNIINKVRIWNVPYKIKDVAPVKGWEKFKNTVKIIFTYITNIDTKTINKPNELLINNRMIIRMLNLKNDTVYSRVTLAAWKSFKRSWKKFNNIYNNFDIKYMQTGKDALCNMQIINKFSMKNNKIYFMNDGYHVASLDDNVALDLFEWIINS